MSNARRGLRTVVQVIGFLIGLGLLAWAVSIALSPESREQLDRLRDATIGQVALLLGLSLTTLIFSGLTFWIVLYPARRLKAVDVIATNALATFLAYLPFKLSIIARVAIHNRRDGVPLLTIGAWFTAFTLSLGAAIGSLLIAALARERIDWIWIVIAVVAMAASTATLIGLGRFFGFKQGEARLHKLLDPLTPRKWRHALRGKRFRELHHGFAMLAHGPAISASVALRVVDLLIQAARFMVAAQVLGVELGFDDAVLLALSYFVIGVASPSGMLGVREMGTTAVASIAAMASSESFATVALLVTAADSIVTVGGAGLGLAWLRPDRLFKSRPRDESASPGESDGS